jgi:hypothetical protein
VAAGLESPAVGRVQDPLARAGHPDRVRRHRYGGLVEPLLAEESLLVKPMFGCLACYVHGRLMLVLADRRPPWRGLLVPTVREHQPALRAEIPSLAVHPVLGKWLYLREAADDFEEAAGRLVALARVDDLRLGVESLPRRSRRARRANRATPGAARRRLSRRARSPARVS